MAFPKIVLLLRKREAKVDTSKIPTKRQKLTASGPSTSSSSSSGGSSQHGPLPHQRDCTDEEDVSDFLANTDFSKYRLHFIKYNSNKEALMRKYYDLYSEVPRTHIWNIIDKRDKKFIDIVITSKIDELTPSEQDLLANTECGSILKIHTETISHKWHNHQDNLRSINKVKFFLEQRKTIMESLGIIETPIQWKSHLEKEIFSSDYFNDGMREWVNIWNSHCFERYSTKDLYDNIIECPSTISCEELQEKLDTLEEDDRAEPIRWKGKIFPEGWGINIAGTWHTDREMCQAFFDLLEEETIEFKGEVGGLTVKTGSYPIKKQPWKNILPCFLILIYIPFLLSTHLELLHQSGSNYLSAPESYLYATPIAVSYFVIWKK